MKHDAILNCLQGCLLPDWDKLPDFGLWDKLPDFGLYMDQMITLVNRSFPGIERQIDLTPSMINNYVKAGLMDKPLGKKYSREAIAQLLMIIQLKLTTPMDLMKTLLHPENGTETKDLYMLFRQCQEQVIVRYQDEETAPRLMYALKSSALQLITRLSDD